MIIDMRCRPPTFAFEPYFDARVTPMTTKLGVQIPPSFMAKSMQLFFEEMEQAGITQGVVVGRNSPGVDLETPPVPAVNVPNDHIAE